MKNLIWGCSEEASKAIKSDSPVTPSGGSISSCNNHIFFYKEVNQDSIADINSKIISTNASIEKSVFDLGIDVTVPIHLHVHSYGGSLIAGLAAADMISKYNIHTHIEGGAASAATFMSVCGKHRTMTKHSHILIHQLSNVFWGKYSELADFNKNMDRFMQVIKDIYKQYTKIPEDKISEILEHDLWFNAQEALEYGMIDEIN